MIPANIFQIKPQGTERDIKQQRTLAQVARKGCGYSLPGSVPGQVGQGFEKFLTLQKNVARQENPAAVRARQARPPSLAGTVHSAFSSAVPGRGVGRPRAISTPLSLPGNILWDSRLPSSRKAATLLQGT